MLRPELRLVAAEGVRAEDERSFDVQRGKGFAVLLHGVHVIAVLFDDVALSVAELLRDHNPEFVLQKRIKRLELEDRACAAQSRQEDDRMISMTCHKNAHPVSVDLDELPERRLDKLSVPRPHDAVDRVRDEPAERDQRGAQGEPRDLEYFQTILQCCFPLFFFVSWKNRRKNTAAKQLPAWLRPAVPTYPKVPPYGAPKQAGSLPL